METEMCTMINKLDNIVKKRRDNASFYWNNLKQFNIFIPPDKENEFNTYHTFVIQCNKRDELANFLESRGIKVAIHYPIPIHKQKAYRNLFHENIFMERTERQSKRILSLPIHQYLKSNEMDYICKSINYFYQND